MIKIGKVSVAAALAMCSLFGWARNPAAADVRIEGQVQAGGAPLASSTVTLWAANAGEPRQLAQTTSGNDGHFVLSTPEALGTDVSLYLIAKGGQTKRSGNNPAIALLSVLGNAPPHKVVIIRVFPQLAESFRILDGELHETANRKVLAGPIPW